MSVKAIALRQYRRFVEEGGSNVVPAVPPEGWLRTVRKALLMSGPQLAVRMGVTRARIAQAEQAELSGAATLRSMQAAAEALGCRFVYAVLPDNGIDSLIAAQARKKALALVTTASTHMALEAQVLADDKIAQSIEDHARNFVDEMPSDFWSDP